MAVTHQTDTEEKVIEMPVIHTSPTRLTLTAPPRMFAVNGSGVPYVATWIYLHCGRVRGASA